MKKWEILVNKKLEVAVNKKMIRKNSIEYKKFKEYLSLKYKPIGMHDIKSAEKIGKGWIKTTNKRWVNTNFEERPLNKTQLMILDALDTKRHVAHIDEHIWSSIWNTKWKTIDDLKKVCMHCIDNLFEAPIHSKEYERIAKKNPTIFKLVKDHHGKK